MKKQPTPQEGDLWRNKYYLLKIDEHRGPYFYGDLFDHAYPENQNTREGYYAEELQTGWQLIYRNHKPTYEDQVTQLEKKVKELQQFAMSQIRENDNLNEIMNSIKHQRNELLDDVTNLQDRLLYHGIEPYGDNNE